MASSHRPRVGVSACLLGERVRYDGGHKRDRFLAGPLARRVEWVPVCPEVEAGMTVPRDAMGLVGAPSSPRLVVKRTGEDKTAAMRAFAHGRVEALAALGLDGYVLKSKSPSCGMAGVPVGRTSGRAAAGGVGLFARALRARLPLLPVEDEARLLDPRRRAAFVERVFAHARWRRLLAEGATPARLLSFHAAHEAWLSTYDPVRCRRLGRVARARTLLPAARAARYGALLLEALAAPRGGHR